MAVLPRPPTVNAIAGSDGTISDEWNRWFVQVYNLLNAALINAPSIAPYILQQANALLPNAQALSQLNSGFVKVTSGTGVLSSQALINESDIKVSGVAAGTYGDSSHSAQITVNAQGFITSATQANITSSQANSVSIIDDNSTNATMYPTWVNSNGGFLQVDTSSSKLTWNPSTAVLTTTTFHGALTGNATTATNLAAAVLLPNGTTVNDPANPLEIANKEYVDTKANSVGASLTAQLATTAHLSVSSGGTVTYNNGSSGVGATLTISGTSGPWGIDGQSFIAGITVLVKNELTAANNGLYLVSSYNAGTGAAVFTRATNYNTAAQINSIIALFVTNGTTLIGTQWGLQSTITTIGTDNLVYTQFFWTTKDTLVIFTDVTTGNASTTAHGFQKKLTGTATNFEDGTGAWRNLASTDLPAVSSPTVQKFTSGTAATYTTAANVKWLRVVMVGGGGGGAGGGVGGNTGNSGTNTTFGTSLHIANGGAGGVNNGAGGAGGSFTIGAGGAGIGAIGGDGGVAPAIAGQNTIYAGHGGSSALGGAGQGAGGDSAGSPATSPTAGKANTGGGGGGNVANNTAFGAGGGGAGGYLDIIIAAPAATYVYTVGQGGAGTSGGTNTGASGGSGVIVVYEYYA